MKNSKIIYSLTHDDYTLARINWILQRDYQVQSFSDTESLHSAMEKGKPDLVILHPRCGGLEIEALIERTKGVCTTCIAYLLLSGSNRNNLSSLFRCNCIVGQVHLPLIPDQLTSAVKNGLELSGMCKIRANLFNMPLPAETAELRIQA